MICTWGTENGKYADMATAVTAWPEANRPRSDKGHPGPVPALGRGSWRERRWSFPLMPAASLSPGDKEAEREGRSARLTGS